MTGPDSGERPPDTAQVSTGKQAPTASADERSGRGPITIEASWEGPLPPPSALAEYDRLVPDGAARLFLQFEAEAKHRRELERDDAATRRLDLLGGQALVAIFLIGAYLVTGLAIAAGANWVAGVIGSLTTALTIFFSARFRQKSRERHGIEDER